MGQADGHKEQALKIAVLDLTEPMPGVLDGIPRVSETIANWLSPALPEAELQSFDIVSGADFPVLANIDGVVVSGSEHGVYDDLPWMQPLRGFLRSVRQANMPVFGICFGHQIMADTFGGKAEKAPQGLHIGMRQFEISGQDVPTHVWHKDQVTQAPPNTRIWAKAAYCPIGALEYDFPAMSVQFHPEYGKSLLYSVFERGMGRFVTDDMVAEADRSFEDGEAERALVASNAADFFRKHLGA